MKFHLDVCKEKLPVIATHINQGRMRIHVFGNTAPDASFEPGTANMEDAYFVIFRGHDTYFLSSIFDNLTACYVN